MPVGTEDRTSVQLKVKDKTYQCSADELKALQPYAASALKLMVRNYAMKAAEARALWDADKDARGTLFHFGPEILDAFSPAPFPPEGLIKAAEAATAKFEAAVKSANPAKIVDAQEDAHDALAAAVKAVYAYHDGLFVGARRVVTGLEAIKAGSGFVLQVLGALASGGASIEAAAAVKASVGTYDALIGQIDKNAGAGKVEPLTAGLTILTKGAVEGLLGAMFFRDAVPSKIIDQLAKAWARNGVSGLEGAVARKAIEKMWKKSLEAGAKSVMRELVAKQTYNTKLTLDEAAKHVAEAVLAGGLAGFALGDLDEKLGAVAKGSLKYVKPEWFRSLGKIDYEKAMKSGGEKVIEAAYKKMVSKVILDAASDPGKLAVAHLTLAKAIASDPQVNQELGKLAKKRP